MFYDKIKEEVFFMNENNELLQLDDNEAEKKADLFNKIIRFLDEKKWIIFILVLLVIFVAFALDSYLKKDQNDIQILYTGYEFLDDDMVSKIKTTCSYLADDYNGDNVLMVDFLPLTVEKKYFDGNYTYDSTMITRFNTELNTSSSIIFIVEDSYYEVLRSSGLLLPLSTVFNELPEGAIDEFGILFGTLDISMQDGFKDLSPDSIICIRRPARDKEIRYISEDQYNYNLDFFKKIIEFSVE